MDLTAHAIAQRLVDKLVSLQLPQPGERWTCNGSLEMHVVFRPDTHIGAGQSRTYQCLNLFWIHVQPFWPGVPAGGTRSLSYDPLIFPADRN
jgi:hypothetical protein